MVFFAPLMPIVIMTKRASIENEATDILYNWVLYRNDSSPSEIFIKYKERIELQTGPNRSMIILPYG